MTAFDEPECLNYYPFEGDFGEPSDRILEDKIVTTRKPALCCMCLGQASPGTRSRVLKAIFEGELRRYRWCGECCAAMVAFQKLLESDDETPEIDPLSVRYQLADQRKDAA